MENGDFPELLIGFFNVKRGFLPDLASESIWAKFEKDKTIPSPRKRGNQVEYLCFSNEYTYRKANLIKFSTLASGFDFKILSKLFSAAVRGIPKVTKAAKASCL